MASHLQKAFAACKADGRPAFVTYLTAGFPGKQDTVALMLALQKGGADIIELGIPFSDPTADGPTIQLATFKAIQNGVTVRDCLQYVRDARAAGLTVPVLFMGYYNPMLRYGEEAFVADAQAAGVSGFIVVDLPPEEARLFREHCTRHALSYVPLIAPSTSEARTRELIGLADSFMYVVSTLGVTGTRRSVDAGLGAFVQRIRTVAADCGHPGLPLAVGFGVSTRAHFQQVGRLADGVVIGSKIIATIDGMNGASLEERAAAVVAYCQDVTSTTPAEVSEADAPSTGDMDPGADAPAAAPETKRGRLDTSPPIGKGLTLASRFGDFGGQYAPEALMDCLSEIEQAWAAVKDDGGYWDEFRSHYSYVGRPSQLHRVPRLTALAGPDAATLWLKREDLNHTGSHKINNALGQVLLARRLGKTRIIAETGAGQHGVATATACAKFGLECVIYMGAEDVRRQSLNVFRIRLLGASVIPVETGSKTLKDAVNEAMRDWVSNVHNTHYIIGSAIGPHPFPTIVRDLQRVIGDETRAYFLEHVGRLPDAVVACVGGGSNAIGMFYPFVNDAAVRMVGVEAGGDGVHTDRHSSALSGGTPGVLHGTKTFLLQNPDGQITETHSISAGLDYPGVGPEHAFLKVSQRAEYVSVSDAECLQGFRALTQSEGIIPALESSHAVFYALELARQMKAGQNIVVCLSGRGDKDVNSVAETLPKHGPTIGWDLRFEDVITHTPHGTSQL
ncbi:hypothetical protein CXG81DRAFT_27470 [Caulochytrium protostelioides]|uniref:Tryptophan synthase n=1 Tax=Caulochytrium protostelioides TaxID=1555241 RepID=A0A4P9X439_9FUNG|nr:hypothetical protein CXG81DRAFT_27470 [Caulochytrium protostelioides]|eukprot:RKO99791.1 hypothetical protein CXG81DRAFT_27470 [Caulochytrium protostelioides]